MAFLDETGLQYYDTKIKEYITQKVSNAVGNITSFRFEVVTELPQTGEVGVIYLKALAEQESSNLYEEFIWVDGSYEFIGTNEIDLSGKADVAALDQLADKLAQREQEIQTLQGQVSDLQTQVNTLLGYYNELENII